MDRVMTASYPEIRIRPDRMASIINRHPWIFSAALWPPSDEIGNGALVSVTDAGGAVVATGTCSRHTTIAVRVFEFGEAIIDKGWLTARVREADERRRRLGLGPGGDVTGYRVVFGESDRLPGLVIDRYEDVLVVQIATAGMDRLREIVVESLIDIFKPKAIYERSDIAARSEEKLDLIARPLFGDDPGSVPFREHGRRYLADIAHGQKTGFYLDQRDLRLEISRLSRDRRAADLFSYSGASGIAALVGGASSAHFVDSSREALALCPRLAELNAVDPARVSTEEADVFQWLGSRSQPEFDLVMIDPPALIKSKRHVESGRKGYHFLNRAAMRIITDGGILVTSSCSAFFTETDFAVTLRRAAEQAGVRLSVLRTVRQAPDHPLSLNFPEAHYLKSFICLVDR